MSESVGDYYLRHDDVARRLGNMDTAELIKLLKGKKFGHRVFTTGRFFYVPTRDFNAFCQARTIFDERGELKPIFARTPGELRRKLALVEETGTAG